MAEIQLYRDLHEENLAHHWASVAIRNIINDLTKGKDLLNSSKGRQLYADFLAEIIASPKLLKEWLATQDVCFLYDTKAKPLKILGIGRNMEEVNQDAIRRGNKPFKPNPEGIIKDLKNSHNSAFYKGVIAKLEEISKEKESGN